MITYYKNINLFILFKNLFLPYIGPIYDDQFYYEI